MNPWVSLEYYVKGNEVYPMHFGPIVPIFGAGIHGLMKNTSPLIFKARNSLMSWNGLFDGLIKDSVIGECDLKMFYTLSPSLRWEMISIHYSDGAEHQGALQSRVKEGR